jgi:hypothetical protein
MKLIKRTNGHSNNINYHGERYDHDIKIKLHEYGIWAGYCGNFECKRKLTEEEINDIAKIISKYDGLYSEYYQWYCEPIKMWRLVYYYKGNRK